MVIHTFNIFDTLLILACVFSALIGAMRGFTREVLSLLGWFSAGLGALYCMPPLRPFMRSMISNSFLADIVGGGVLFLFFLIIFLMLNQAISSRVKQSLLSGLDRALGLLFGVVRGIVLICFSYLCFLFFIPEDQHPSFITTAKTTPWIQEGSHLLKSFIPLEILPSSLKNSSPSSEIKEVVKTLSTFRPISSKREKNN